MAETAASRNAAEEVVQALVEYGIKQVFGMTGDTVLPILDVLYDQRNEIRYVAGKGEIGVASMGDVVMRVDGAKRLYDEISSCDKLLKLWDGGEGGSVHCNYDNWSVSIPFMFDWLAKRL